MKRGRAKHIKVRLPRLPIGQGEERVGIEKGPVGMGWLTELELNSLPVHTEALLFVLHILGADFHHLPQDRLTFHQCTVPHFTPTLEILEILHTTQLE